MKPDRRESGHKPRAYIDEVVKAASHPVRQRILKRLQQSTCLTGELEEETHESRHNLYHHLAVLKEVGLVGERMRSNRLKIKRQSVSREVSARKLLFSWEE